MQGLTRDVAGTLRRQKDHTVGNISGLSQTWQRCFCNGRCFDFFIVGNRFKPFGIHRTRRNRINRDFAVDLNQSEIEVFEIRFTSTSA